jgi:ABC-type spermidine/putrescine transport system permease subunit II
MSPSQRAAWFGAAGRVALWAYTAVILLFLLVPIAIIVIMSFSDQPYLTFPPPGWTLHWYAAVQDQPRWLAAASNSIRIGVPSALLAVFFGTLAALGIARSGSRWAKPMTLLVLAPMMVPHVIIAIGLFPTLVDLRLINTYSAVVIGHSVIGIPLVFVTVSAALRAYPASLDLAARTLGASPWRTFMRVTVPMTWAGIASGGLLAFAASFDELMLALFLTSASTETLPRMIWDQLSFALTPALAAVATLILALSMILLGAAAVIGSRKPTPRRALS